MFISYWMQCQCPSCNKNNWVYDTHSARAYPDSIYAMKCWSCGASHWLSDESEQEAKETHGEELTVEDVAEEGKETP